MAFLGNFWAFTCDWIRHLDNIKSEGPFLTYVGAEIWIGNHSSWERVNRTEFLNLFDHKDDRSNWNGMVLLSEVPIFPSFYKNITGNRSMWPQAQVEIWEDYLQGLQQIQEKKMKKTKSR